MDIKERRQTVRWQINSPGQLVLEDCRALVNCTILDINYKGVQVLMDKPLENAKLLKVSVVLSEECYLDSIDLRSVWHRKVPEGELYGLYFNRIKDIDKEKIYKFVFKHSPRQIHQQWWQESDKRGGELMEDMGTNDKRVFARFPVQMALRFIDLLSNTEGQAHAYDISAKGLGFMATEELKPLTPLEMWLQVPDKGEPLYTRGEVVWSEMVEPNKYKAGINLERADLMGVSRVLRTLNTI
jgi:hypothetical protein